MDKRRHILKNRGTAIKRENLPGVQKWRGNGMKRSAVTFCGLQTKQCVWISV